MHRHQGQGLHRLSPRLDGWASLMDRWGLTVDGTVNDTPRAPILLRPQRAQRKPRSRYDLESVLLSSIHFEAMPKASLFCFMGKETWRLLVVSTALNNIIAVT